MTKSSRRIIQGLLRFHFYLAQTQFSTKQVASSPICRRFSSTLSNGCSDSSTLAAQNQSELGLQLLVSRRISSNVVLRSNLNCVSLSLGIPCRNLSSGNLKRSSISCRTVVFGGLYIDPLRVGHFSLRNIGAKASGNAVQKVVAKPISAVKSVFSRYREAVGLQIEGFWKRNYLFVVGAGGLASCILLWRIMFGIANTFVGLSEGMAKYGFLALSSAIVAFAGLYIRSRYTINPDRVYRMAMRKLNTSASILEVMGAPLTGTDLRAYVMSGGGLTMYKFKPRLRSKRCFLIFPIRGSERRGLVSIEVKKKKGQHDIKLLAVDIPMASGPEQRLFLVGDEEEYRIGGGLVGELRDPMVKAMAATKEFEKLEEIEEEEEVEREMQEAERKHQDDIARLERERAE
ncbi:hypothetical protein Dimus_022395 [Dionaea muscipula]